jgi:hypothetical protein
MKQYKSFCRALICSACIVFLCSSVFAKTKKTSTVNANSKTGIVTSISMDAIKNTVTITLSLGTLKSPDKSTAPDKESRQPPKRPSISDFIELTGETVTFTVSADTKVARSMIGGNFTPPETEAADASNDTSDSTADSKLPAPPAGPAGPDGARPDFVPPQMMSEVSDVTLNEVLTVTFDTTGSTVTAITEDSGEPPHGPDGMGPRPDMGGPNGNGGQMGPGPQGGMGGPSGGRR